MVFKVSCFQMMQPAVEREMNPWWTLREEEEPSEPFDFLTPVVFPRTILLEVNVVTCGISRPSSNVEKLFLPVSCDARLPYFKYN